MKIGQEQLEVMRDAYEYLFTIENTLRHLIQTIMAQEHGTHWQFIAARKYINTITKKDFQTLNYHETVSCYNIYPELTQVFPSKIIPQLHRLTPIRNKIAHNRIISREEFELLYSVYQRIQVNSEQSAI